MKKFLLITLLFINVVYSQVRYVTPTGNSSNNGLTEANAWSWSHAVSNATAGMTVYVKAGVYNDYRVTINNNGTISNPIKFIGYKNTIGDINATSQTLLPQDTRGRRGTTKLAGNITYDYTTAPSSNEMPYFNKSYVRDETAIIINGDYIEIHNIIINGYSNGIFIYSNSTGCKVYNSIFREQGNQNVGVAHGSDPDRYKGEAIRNYGTNSDIQYNSILNAEQQAISFLGANSGTCSNNVMYSYNMINGTDYFMLLSNSGGVNSTGLEIEYNLFDRVPGVPHGGHGPICKNGANNNVFRYFEVRNCNIEANFANVYDNTWEKGTILGGHYTNNDNATYILITNGAHHNTFKDIIVDGSWGAIVMHDYDDGASSDPNIDKASAGNDNNFINIVAKNCKYFLIFSETGTNSPGGATNNNFIGSTIYDCEFAIRSYMYNSGNKFYNTTFNTTSGFNTNHLSHTLNSNTVFENCHGFGSSSLGSFSSYAGSNNITGNPNFVNTGSLIDYNFNVTGLKLQANSPLINSGQNTSLINPLASTDLEGNTRSLPFDIGAYEYGSSGNTCTNTSSIINQLIDSGNSYVFNSQTLTNTGVYKDTLINAGGCDSVVTLNLTFNAIYEACKKNNSAQIVIDGTEEGLWNGVSSIYINQPIIGNVTPISTDISAEAKFLWDDTNLYILVKVMDDILVSDNTGTTFDDDGFSLYIDGANENSGSYDLNDHNILFNYGKTDIKHNSVFNSPGIEKSETAIAGGYQMEIKISWSVIGVVPNSSTPVGLEIHLNDDDDGGNRDKKIVWNDQSDLSYTNPSKLGMLILSNECYNYSTICNNNLSIVIDGLEEPQWTTQEDTLLKIIDGVITNDSDASAVFKLMWDATNLYVLAKITDDIKMNDSPNSWEDDGIEIFIDGDNDKNNVYDADDRQYIIRWNDNSVHEYGYNTSTNPVGVVFAQTNTPTGYIIEGSIAWSSIGLTPSALSVLGFEIQLNDDDGASLDGRRSWNALVSPSGNPSLMGVLELDGSTCSNTTEVTTNTLNELTVYPNPTSDNVLLKSETTLTKVELYNSLGELVLTKQVNSKQVNISLDNLPRGIYSLKSYSELSILTNQLIKL